MTRKTDIASTEGAPREQAARLGKTVADFTCFIAVFLASAAAILVVAIAAPAALAFSALASLFAPRRERSGWRSAHAG